MNRSVSAQSHNGFVALDCAREGNSGVFPISRSTDKEHKARDSGQTEVLLDWVEPSRGFAIYRSDPVNHSRQLAKLIAARIKRVESKGGSLPMILTRYF